MTTHPTTTHATHATATAPTCVRCARLSRELSRLTGRLDLLMWAVHRLAEQQGQHHLAAFLDALCEEEPEEKE